MVDSTCLTMVYRYSLVMIFRHFTQRETLLEPMYILIQRTPRVANETDQFIILTVQLNTVTHLISSPGELDENISTERLFPQEKYVVICMSNVGFRHTELFYIYFAH